MFSTLLLAAVVAVSVVNAQTFPASFCPSNTNKCSRERPAVTAFCSSYISIKDTTITRTNTVRPTTSVTNTRTITALAATVTAKPTNLYKTITNCVAPAVTPLPQDDTPWDPLPEGDPWPERRAVEEDHELVRRQATSTVRKPTCLYNIGGRSTISAACKCFSIKPTQRTVTRTATATKTTVTVFVTTTIRSTRTVAGSTSTTYVFAQPTFLIANNRGGYAEAECYGEDELVGQARMSFDDASADAVLFTLNSDRTLSALEGKPGKVFEVVPPQGEDADISVLSGQPGTDTPKPLTCYITQNADGTCPLACKVNDNGDVNQGSGMNDWFFGPPGVVTDYTYDTFAVTRNDPNQRGTCQSGRARIMNVN